MTGYPKTPPAPRGTFDAAIDQAATLGQLEALAGIDETNRVEFWLMFAGIEKEPARIAAGIAELKRRIRTTGMMA
jgi:hypothetical protein